MHQIHFVLMNVLIIALKPDDPNFWSRFIGMAIVSLLLGFVIGSGLGFVVYMFVSGIRPNAFSIKSAMGTGGVNGAIAGPLILAYFVF